MAYILNTPVGTAAALGAQNIPGVALEAVYRKCRGQD